MTSLCALERSLAGCEFGVSACSVVCMTRQLERHSLWDNYHRRSRYEAASMPVRRFFVWLFIWAFVFCFLWVFLRSFFHLTDSGFVCETRPITVQAGDTLDDIVREFCAGQVTEALDQVVRVYGATIHPNDTLYLPASDLCPLLTTDSGQVYDDC
jgi:hypothetical protein